MRVLLACPYFEENRSIRYLSSSLQVHCRRSGMLCVYYISMTGPDSERILDRVQFT
jgi:hypothetical protein